MEKYNIKNLYLARPSIVVCSKTRIIKEDDRELKKYYCQKVKLEQRPKEYDIISINDNEINNITSLTPIEFFNNTYEYRKRYIGMNKKDYISLKKIINKLLLKNFIKTKKIKNLFINNKKNFTEEELNELLDQIKENNDDTIKVKKIEKKYSINIPCGIQYI